MKYTFIISLFFLCIGCSSNQQEAKKSISKEAIISQLEVGFDNEQNIRKKMIEKMDAGEFDMALNDKMGEIDSINQILAVKYLDTYGWPKISEVGKKLSYGIFYIVQHADTEMMKNYLPQLEKMADMGEAKKKHLAMMTDRVLMDEKKHQIYGTQCAARKDSNGYVTMDQYVWPIENNLIVDSLRKEMGFDDTVVEYAKKMDAEYNLNEPL